MWCAVDDHNYMCHTCFTSTILDWATIWPIGKEFCGKHPISTKKRILFYINKQGISVKECFNGSQLEKKLKKYIPEISQPWNL